MLVFVLLSCIPIMVIIFQVKRLMDTRLLPRGWTWHIYICIFFGTGHSCCICLGLLNKSCILKCFIFSTVYCRVQFYSPGASIIMGLHYHIMLDFCEMNSVLGGIF